MDSRWNMRLWEYDEIASYDRTVGIGVVYIDTTPFISSYVFCPGTHTVRELRYIIFIWSSYIVLTYSIPRLPFSTISTISQAKGGRSTPRVTLLRARGSSPVWTRCWTRRQRRRRETVPQGERGGCSWSGTTPCAATRTTGTRLIYSTT